MNPRRTYRAALMVGLTLMVAIGSDAMPAQEGATADSLLLLAPPDLTWASTNRPDTMRAVLWGDSSKGPFAFFSRYDGGWELPPHFHTNDLRGLIISGTFVIHVTGRAAKELSAGSYFAVPGKTTHTDLCLPGPPCLVYFTGDAPLDRVNVP